MGYGHSFNNVQDSKATPWSFCRIADAVTARAHLFLSTFRRIGVWGTLNQVMKRFPLLYPLVFLVLPPRLALVLPTLLKSNLQIVQKRVAGRKDLKHPDYFSLLVPEDKPAPPDDFLVAQANHLIVGGFDPDTNLFTAAVHYLLEYPDTFERLKSEIRDNFPSYGQLNNDTLQSMPYLHAVIEETLRLHTNGAFGLPRFSPGDTVDGHYIEKGVSFVPQLYKLVRCLIDGSASSKPLPSQSRTRSASSKTPSHSAQSVGYVTTMLITTTALLPTIKKHSSPSQWALVVALARTWATCRAALSWRR